jgi:hypothetical protein
MAKAKQSVKRDLLMMVNIGIVPLNPQLRLFVSTSDWLTPHRQRRGLLFTLDTVME